MLKRNKMVIGNGNKDKKETLKAKRLYGDQKQTKQLTLETAIL